MDTHEPAEFDLHFASCDDRDAQYNIRLPAATVLHQNNIEVDVREVQGRHHFDAVLGMNAMSVEVTQALVRQILSA